MEIRSRIELIKADITTLAVDAIVNAANRTLLGGGGVDAAIHRAAGHGLYDECKKLNGCETGMAKITNGYHLPAKFVIHTVGPVWKGGNHNEQQLLASCYDECLQLALEHKLQSIAFPNISTGVYGFPKPEAARIALSRVQLFLDNNDVPLKVIFCSFDDENYALYNQII
jgi:O-acetyl-ADP-ribose deacetylase (regulator of RNase III)